MCLIFAGNATYSILVVTATCEALGACVGAVEWVAHAANGNYMEETGSYRKSSTLPSAPSTQNVHPHIKIEVTFQRTCQAG